jgi:hypothetical protein
LPIETNIDKDKGLRNHKVTGKINLTDLVTALKELYESPQFDSDMDVLWDLRNADLTSFTFQEIEQLKDYVTRHWGTKGKSRAAMLVSRDLDYGLSRMYEMLSSGKSDSQIQAFHDLGDAMQWLDNN